MESNGTLPATPGIDWLCISPKAGSEVVQRAGDELKLVWPQPGIDPAALLDWDFGAYLVQPMDCGSEEANAQAREAAIALVMTRARSGAASRRDQSRKVNAAIVKADVKLFMMSPPIPMPVRSVLRPSEHFKNENAAPALGRRGVM